MIQHKIYWTVKVDIPQLHYEKGFDTLELRACVITCSNGMLHVTIFFVFFLQFCLFIGLLRDGQPHWYKSLSAEKKWKRDKVKKNHKNLIKLSTLFGVSSQSGWPFQKRKRNWLCITNYIMWSKTEPPITLMETINSFFFNTKIYRNYISYSNVSIANYLLTYTSAVCCIYTCAPYRENITLHLRRKVR